MDGENSEKLEDRGKNEMGIETKTKKDNGVVRAILQAIKGTDRSRLKNKKKIQLNESNLIL